MLRHIWHPNGALLLTIGERRGFTIDPKYKTAHDEAYYVVSKDVKKNTITVSNERNAQISMINDQLHSRKEISISRVNWTSTAPKIGDKVEIRVRYRQTLTPAIIQSIKDDIAVIVPEKEVDAVTPGQSLVMYKGEECLGGGVIV